MSFFFKKEERLKSRKAFENLIRSNTAFFSHPLRIIWIKTDVEQPFPAKVAFAVPKKNFKRAVQRNLLKRRMREAYRLHKHELYSFLEKNNSKVHILIVYIGKDISPYHEIENKILGFFKHFMAKF